MHTPLLLSVNPFSIQCVRMYVCTLAPNNKTARYLALHITHKASAVALLLRTSVNATVIHCPSIRIRFSLLLLVLRILPSMNAPYHLPVVLLLLLLLLLLILQLLLLRLYTITEPALLPVT
jgi:hypothetical protein